MNSSYLVSRFSESVKLKTSQQKERLQACCGPLRYRALPSLPRDQDPDSCALFWVDPHPGISLHSQVPPVQGGKRAS